jgi:hypothetical protein
VCGLACKRTYHQQIINNGFPEGFSLAKVFLFFILGPIMVIYVLVARYGTLSSKGFCAPFFAVKCRDLTGLRIIKLLMLMMVLDLVPMYKQFFKARADAPGAERTTPN